jgi:hypothetical protein
MAKHHFGHTASATIGDIMPVCMALGLSQHWSIYFILIDEKKIVDLKKKKKKDERMVRD